MTRSPSWSPDIGPSATPGNAFSVAQSATNFMRFNVSQTLDDRIFAVLREALRQADKSR
jgi:hypothetical protein